jgi:uncharacterized membrane protein YphA (DoxX/SURF4 family)
MSGVLLALVRAVVGLVSLTAGVLKLAQRSDSAAGFRKLLGISHPASRLLTFGLAAIEVSVGSLLISGLLLSIVLPLAAIMFGAFGIVVVLLLKKGEAGRSCGCMGRKGRIGATLAAQDFGLMLLSLGLWLGRDHVAFIFVIVAGTLLFLAPAAGRLSSWRHSRGVRLQHATGSAQH